jgi:hypothetical protein
MSEPIQGESVLDLPESNIQPRSTFSIVWIVPLVAILIGAWIGYKAWSEMGQKISITFKTAAGLEAGKTLPGIFPVITGGISRPSNSLVCSPSLLGSKPI